MAKSAEPPMSPGPWKALLFLLRKCTGKPSSDCLAVSFTFSRSLRTAFRVVLPWPALQAILIAVALTQTDVYVGTPNVSGFPPWAFTNALYALLVASIGKPDT